MVNNVNSINANSSGFRSKNVIEFNIHTNYVASLQHLNFMKFCALILIPPETAKLRRKLTKSTYMDSDRISVNFRKMKPIRKLAEITSLNS